MTAWRLLDATSSFVAPAVMFGSHCADRDCPADNNINTTVTDPGNASRHAGGLNATCYSWWE